jgi:hypothetical protein
MPALMDSLTKLVGRYSRPAWLLLISAVMTGFYMLGKPYIMYDDSDPFSYVIEAWSIVGRSGGLDMPFRGPGYSIWMILTGMATLDFWSLLIGSQILMAVVIPILIYEIVAPVSRNGAFVAGLLFISFGAAYNHMMWVMSEQVFLFAQFLAFALISRYLFLNRSTPLLYGIVVLLAYDTMIRPAAALYFWIFLAVCLMFRVGSWRQYLTPAALYLAIMVAWSGYDYYNGSGLFPGTNVPATQSQRYFAEAYYGRTRFHVSMETDPDITPRSGPASAKLHTLLVKRVAAGDGPNFDDAETRRELVGKYSSAEELVQAMFARPNQIYFNFITSAAGDDLLYEVARENGHTGLRGLGRYFVTYPQAAIMGAPQSYVGRLFWANFYRYTEMKESGFFFIGSLDRNLIREENGPASKEYVRTLLYFLDTFPEIALHDPNKYLEIFGSKEKLKAYVQDPTPWQLPNGNSVLGMIEGSVFIWLSYYYGEAKTDRLLRSVALETIAAHPNSVLLFLDNFLRVTIMRHFVMDYGGKTFASFSNLWAFVKRGVWNVKDMRSSVLPPSLAEQLTVTTTHSNNFNTTLFIQYYFLWRLLKIVFVTTMLLVIVPLVINPRTAPLAAFLFLAYLYNALAISIVIGNFDLPRWEDIFIFFPVLLTVMGACVIAPLVRSFRAAPANPG